MARSKKIDIQPDAVKKNEFDYKPHKESKVKNKPKLSRFLITLSTHSDDERAKQFLIKAYNKFYDNIREFLIIPKGYEKDTKITKITSEGSIEKGPTYGKVHMHALVSIYHNGKVHINNQKLWQVLGPMLTHDEDDLKIRKYIHVRFISDPSWTIKNYINKDNDDDI